MHVKAVVMDSMQVARSVTRIAHEIIEDAKDCKGLCLVGVHRRGVPLARRLADLIEKFEGVRPEVGTLDITLYRDDLSQLREHPQVKGTDILFAIKDKRVVLVDDVLYTGRTARAAMDCLLDMGRAAVIRYAVLVDRGHHELPIRADFIGKNLPSSHNEFVRVRLAEIDGEDSVTIEEDPTPVSGGKE